MESARPAQRPGAGERRRPVEREQRAANVVSRSQDIRRGLFGYALFSALLLGACGGSSSQVPSSTPANRSERELPPAPRVSGAEARARVAAGALLLDVTPPTRADDSFIDGRVHIPLGELPERMHELPRDRSIVVHCYGGRGSPRAGAMLQAAGYDVVVMGPRSAWFENEEPSAL